MSDNITVIDLEKIKEHKIPKLEPTALSDETKTEEEIEINIKEQAKEQKTKINFRDNSYLKNHFNKEKEVPGGGSVNIDEAKKRLEDSTTKQEPEEISTSSTADIVVEVLDWILVSFITWFSGDKNEKEYETDNAKKKILKKHFSEWILVKQKKFPTEFLLITAWLSIYFYSGKKAWNNRKQNEFLKKNKMNNPLQTSQEEKKKRKIKHE